MLTILLRRSEVHAAEVPESPESERRARFNFFASLFSHPACGLINVRAISKTKEVRKKFFWPTDISKIEPFIKEYQEWNLYFGVAARLNSTSGALKNCTLIRALFVDIDFKDTPRPEALRRLRAHPKTPTYLIESGNGFHAYWLFDPAVDLRVKPARDSFRKKLRKLAEELGGDLRSAEPAHVLRIPGTLNHKKEYEQPRRVRFTNL